MYSPQTATLSSRLSTGLGHAQRLPPGASKAQNGASGNEYLHVMNRQRNMNLLHAALAALMQIISSFGAPYE